VLQAVAERDEVTVGQTQEAVADTEAVLRMEKAIEGQ